MTVPPDLSSASRPSGRPVSGPSGARPIWSGLGVQVLIGTALGGVVGLLFPMIGPDLKILGDIFLKLVKVIVAPLVFLTVFGGIIAAGDFRKVGRVSVVALIYFEIVSTLALLIGLGAGFLFGVGRGAHPAAGLAAGAQTKAAAAKLPSVSDFLLQVFPDNFFGAFTKGEILQVLMLAILLGVSIRTMGAGSEAIGRACTIATSAMYRLTHTVMLLAPIGAFGAMAFTLSTNGLHVLGVLAWWIGVYYLTQIAFIVVLHGAICLAVGVNLFEILTCIREEIVLVLGTASSESALPGLLEKIPALGVSAQCTALVVPSGYILNLGGAAIYLSMGVAFLANMYGLHLGWAQIGGILLVMLFTSKGVATVAGGSFVTFAATVTATGILPPEGLPLMFGVYRLMAPANSTCNAVSNAIAAVVIGKACGEYVPTRRALAPGGAR